MEEKKSRADTFYDWPPNPFCIDCRHYRTIQNYGSAPKRMSGLVCHYILDTGHKRGCPFGAGCKRKE